MSVHDPFNAGISYINQYPEYQDEISIDIDLKGVSPWFKVWSENEENMYKLLASHPRIVRYLGVDSESDYIILQRLNNGDLWSYLHRHPSISLKTRLTWAVEIAQGMAHIHSKHVVWADAHLRNILLTDDFHVVLCDFAFSVLKPPICHHFPTAPPPIFMVPLRYTGMPTSYVDVFGFGVIFYALLTNRFPFCDNLIPDEDKQQAAFRRHSHSEFDPLNRVGEELLDASFGQFLTDCFKIKFKSAFEMTKALESAYKSWKDAVGKSKSNVESMLTSDDAPYPEEPEFIPLDPVPSFFIMRPGDE
ncbi:kinase-like protein [Dendrothele bispora CBS 962.96]|uniref:Kinase-like protein n=1 Tax=Dendrothele bispora (strain CBS 962.96) TaxID=1314807 RepID=A0A4S8M251_DENBC|nr:kinase-like protein [Dendrothele bispora CBS 962.96]THU96167.1 kinase-like protein [Dendrothele bispora CBS 962.96]